MTRPFRARARASSAMAGRALALLAFAASAGVSDAAYYYGRYGRGWGGRAAVRTTTVVRTRRGVYGRRLLQDEAEPPLAAALAPAPASGDAGDDATECDTILDVVTSRPEFSTLASALEDLPRLREAMDSPERTDTFFAPTNEAIDALLQWGGFVEKAKVRERARRSEPPRNRPRRSEPPRNRPRRNARADRSPVASRVSTFSVTDDRPAPSSRETIPLPSLTPKGIDEMLGNVSLKALIIAYHAIPDVTYTAADLAAKGADDSEDRYVDTALGRVLESAEMVDPANPGTVAEPLLVDENLGDVFLKGIGSEAKVVTPNIPACGSVVPPWTPCSCPSTATRNSTNFKNDASRRFARGRAPSKKRETPRPKIKTTNTTRWRPRWRPRWMAPEMAPEMA